MRKNYYRLFLLIGLIPITYLLFLILVSCFFGFALSGRVIYLVPMILGISGYLGFLSLLRGLKTQFLKLNLVLIGIGLIGFNWFLFFDDEMKNIAGKILSGKGNFQQWVLYISPNIVCIAFIIFIVMKLRDKFYTFI